MVQHGILKSMEFSTGIIIINELPLWGAPITDNAFDIIVNDILNQLQLLLDILI